MSDWIETPLGVTDSGWTIGLQADSRALLLESMDNADLLAMLGLPGDHFDGCKDDAGIQEEALAAYGRMLIGDTPVDRAMLRDGFGWGSLSHDAVMLPEMRALPDMVRAPVDALIINALLSDDIRLAVSMDGEHWQIDTWLHPGNPMMVVAFASSRTFTIDAGEDQEFVLRLTHDIPETAAAAIVGRPLSDLIRHPVLADMAMTVSEVRQREGHTAEVHLDGCAEAMAYY